MIFGGCPHCDASQMNAYAGPGQFQRIECEDCHKVYWLKHSNFEPEAFTEDDFLQRYEVNAETKIIIDKAAEKAKKSRADNPALWALIDTHTEEVAKVVAKKIADNILYGTPLA